MPVAPPPRQFLLAVVQVSHSKESMEADLRNRTSFHLLICHLSVFVSYLFGILAPCKIKLFIFFFFLFFSGLGIRLRACAC
jgi:hypothetical protein